MEDIQGLKRMIGVMMSINEMISVRIIPKVMEYKTILYIPPLVKFAI